MYYAMNYVMQYNAMVAPVWCDNEAHIENMSYAYFCHCMSNTYRCNVKGKHADFNIKFNL